MMAAILTALTLGELIGAAAGPHGEVAISGLTLDSRSVEAGTAFLAVPGAAAHGLDYAAEALARGAAAVLYEPAAPGSRDVPASTAVPVLPVSDLSARIGDIAQRFYWRDRAQPAIYGVTGTNGKTTVTWLVARALLSLGLDCAYVGTLGWGPPDRLRKHGLTTPDCLSLHRELAVLGTDHAAVEVSSHGLVQQRVAGLDFTGAAVTNLSRDHLDAHGSMAAYAAAKRRILALPGLDFVVLNLDDDFSASLVYDVPAGARTIRVTRQPGLTAELSARVTHHGAEGLALDVGAAGYSAALRSPLLGDFNAENLLVAAGILVGAGIELPTAADALGGAPPPPGRLETFRRDDGLTAVVDYAHTPAALERVVTLLAGLRERELVCVFGCGGDRDRGKRAAMGRAAAAADRVVLTDDNPRNEDPAAIVAAIRDGLRADQPVVVEHDRETAIRAAIGSSSAGDIVLIAGKGHETTQVAAGVSRALDDRAIVRAALEAAA